MRDASAATAPIIILQSPDSGLFNSMITPLAALGNLMGMDGLIILVILLLLFGAKKLPELARGLGQSLNEFKKARDDFEHEIRSGQQDPQAREATSKQAHTPNLPAAVPSQTLPYNATAQTVATPEQSPEALRKQVEQLQSQLRAMEEKKPDVSQVG